MAAVETENSVNIKWEQLVASFEKAAENNDAKYLFDQLLEFGILRTPIKDILEPFYLCGQRMKESEMANYKNKFYMTGSSVEKLSLRKMVPQIHPEFDIMINIGLISKYRAFAQLVATDDPGYYKINLYDEVNWSLEFIKKVCAANKHDTKFLNSEKFLARIREAISAELNEKYAYVKKVKPTSSSPALTLCIKNPDPSTKLVPEFFMDLVFFIETDMEFDKDKCSAAVLWYPGLEKLLSVTSRFSGTTLVAKSLSHSDQWRLSFSFLEKELMSHFTDEEKLFLIRCKMFKKIHLSDTVLCSFHVKMACIEYLIDRRKKSLELSNLSDRRHELLLDFYKNHFLNKLENGELLHIFQKDINLFKKFSKDDLDHAFKRITQVIKRVSSENVLKQNIFDDQFTEDFVPANSTLLDSNKKKTNTSSGIKVERKEAHSDTGILALLHEAAKQGNKDVVRRILSKALSSSGSIFVNISTDKGKIALHYASKRGHHEVIELLLEHGADIDKMTSAGFTPLMYACAYVQSQAVDILLNHGANPNLTKSGSSRSALILSTYSNSNRDVERLLQAGANATLSADGTFPLLIAAHRGHLEIVKTLLDAGADVNQLDSEGSTALHQACYSGFYEVAKVLIDHEADVNLVIKENGTSPLFGAAQFGFKDIVELLCQNSDVIVDAARSDGATPMYIASERGHLETCRILLKHGANINHCADMNDAVLSAAVKSKDAELVEFLLDNGADALHVDEGRMTCSHHAARLGSLSIIKLLCKRGVLQDLENVLNMTPFHLACRDVKTEIVKYLISKKADLKLSSWKINPLTIIVQVNAIDCLKVLLEECSIIVDGNAARGIDLLNYRIDPQKNTLLHYAVHFNRIPLLQYLINIGANLEIYNKNGDTPLMYGFASSDPTCACLLMDAGVVNYPPFPLMAAAWKCHSSIVKLYLEKKLPVKSEDKTGAFLHSIVTNDFETFILLEPRLENINKTLNETWKQENSTHGIPYSGILPFCAAAEQGNKNIIDIFIKRKVNVNDADSDGRTPLFYATQEGYIEVVQVLLQNGATVNHRSSNGITALHLAAQYGRHRIVQLLIARGADVNVQGNDGETCIYLASQNGHTEVVTSLIENGADISLMRLSGAGPIHTAAENGCSEVMDALIKAGTDVNAQTYPPRPFSPLYAAVSRRNIDIVKKLLEANADPNMENDEQGSTALHVAAYLGFGDIIEVLIEFGAIINKATKSGITSIMEACQNKQVETVVQLICHGADVQLADEDGDTVLSIAQKLECSEIVEILTEVGTSQ